jgi:hypothetical protein
LSIDVNAAMVDYTLRTVGRILFGADVDDGAGNPRDVSVLNSTYAAGA